MVDRSPDLGWRHLVEALILRVQRELHVALEGRAASSLDRAQVVDLNPPGWLAWHLTRSYDRNVSEIAEQEQRWTECGWHARFGRPADPGDTGFGHSNHDVALFRTPSAEVTLAYHDDVVTMVLAWLETAPDGDLSRIATSPTLGNNASVLDRLVGILNEALQHLGQINLTLGMR
ncbi:MAG: DinB family protein [Ilumatobacteraceae bacterium]|nr:DinB family protein [Acidimicrobiales bacterium]